MCLAIRLKLLDFEAGHAYELMSFVYNKSVTIWSADLAVLFAVRVTSEKKFVDCSRKNEQDCGHLYRCEVMSVSSVRPVLFQTMKNVMSRAPMMTKFYMDQEKVEDNSKMLFYSEEVHNN